MPRIRILMPMPYPDVKGPIARHSRVLIDELQKLDCEIDTAVWGKRRENESLFEKIFGRFGDVLKIRKTLTRNRYDILLVKTFHDWFSILRDTALVLLTKGRSRKTIIQLHGSVSHKFKEPGQWLFKLCNRIILRNSDAILVLSHEERRDFLKFQPGANVVVVENPYIEKRTASDETRPEKDSAANILFVGRLIEAKGLFELLDAVSLLQKKELNLTLRESSKTQKTILDVIPAQAGIFSPHAPPIDSRLRGNDVEGVLRDKAHNIRLNVRLTIVGDGPEEENLRRKAESLGVSSIVNFAGYCAGEDLMHHYRAADIFVLPSWSEGFPTVISEAMDFSLPIVTTKIRGMADHLVEGENAFFAPKKDAEKLAAALEKLVVDPTLRQKMGVANKEKLPWFAPGRVAERYLEVVSSITESSTILRRDLQTEV